MLRFRILLRWIVMSEENIPLYGDILGQWIVTDKTTEFYSIDPKDFYCTYPFCRSNSMNYQEIKALIANMFQFNSDE